ncbi:MAG TPA: PH domain-containing protein, partial [Candidatus Nanopelagicales bacterium]|nr:PH domain-containing protein [Candidatus Nanopelagicales bacterium]
PLAKVNNVSFNVGIMGRILNYGTLEIESASDDGDMYIQDVPDVEQIQRLVYELHELDDSRRRAGDGSEDELPALD